MTFADNFSGTSLDTMKWSEGAPWDAGLSTPSNVSVNNGVLDLSSVRTSSVSSSASFTNSYIATENTSYNELFGMTYGYVEASMQLPSLLGSWPAFWMLASGWPPEIDIMEGPAFVSGTYGNYSVYNYSDNIHYSTSESSLGDGDHYADAGNLTQGFNTYAMSWTPTSVSFYINGVAQPSSPITNSTALSNGQDDLLGNGPMYLLLDNIGGGSWPGVPSTSQWPVGTASTLQVQWVRVWKSTSGSASSTSWNNTSGNSGSWTSAGDWTSGVPQLSSRTAVFGANAVNNQTVNWNDSQTVGGLTFNSTTSYTIGSATGSLMLANTAYNSSGGGSGGSVLIDATGASGSGANYLDCRLELFDNATMQTSSKPLIVGGWLVGTGGLTIAAGPVTLAGSSSYSGGTTLNGGTLTVAADGALGSGPVQFNTVGNGYTAELALSGSVELDNPITLTARNNSTIAFDNLGGENTLAGRISLQVGGSNYGFQSNAGKLTLSGGSGGTAITLAAGVSGKRTVTFQGAGSFLVSGALVNGNSGSLAVLVDGPGVVELSASDSYSGGTTVSGGELVVSNDEGLEDGSTLFVGSGFSRGGSPFGMVQPAADAAGAATPMPEPDTLGLLAAGVTSVVAVRLRRRIGRSSHINTSIL